RLTGAKFYAYLLDQYSHMVSYVLGKSFLRKLEPLIMKSAKAVIVPNEFLRESIEHRFHIASVVIHNPCDLALYDDSASCPETDHRIHADTDHAKIVYTGAI